MREVRKGVFVDEPLPAHTAQVDKDWTMILTIGSTMPLPRAVVVNGQRYERKSDAGVPATAGS